MSLYAFLSLILLLGWVACADAANAYVISGAVTNTTGKTGRTYLFVNNSNGYGTSIDTSGTFAIRGVTPGDYTVTAVMDPRGDGKLFATDPIGVSSSFKVTTTDIGSIAVTLTNPPPPAPPTPSWLKVYPGSGCAALRWQIPANNNPYLPIADHYNLYWSTSPSVSPTNTSGGGSKLGIPHPGYFAYFMPGLTDGATLYFVITAVVKGVEGAPSPVYGPVTIGPPATPGVSVQGTFNLLGFNPTGPLYLLFADISKSTIFTKYFSNPASSQSFRFDNIPEGYYWVMAMVDMNNNGADDPGDVSEGDFPGASSPFLVQGTTMSGLSLNLNVKNSDIGVFTEFVYPNQYSLFFEGKHRNRQITNMTVTSGPNLSQPLDVPWDDGFFDTWSFSLPGRPTVGNTYDIDLRYAGGTFETRSVPITDVLDGYASAVSPNGTAGSLTPVMTWTPPSPLPSLIPFIYRVNVKSTTTRETVWKYEVPSTRTTVVYNEDGTAIPLVSGDQYVWKVEVKDQRGNRSSGPYVTFTAPPVINGVCGSANGQSFTSAPTVNLCAAGAASTVTGAGPWNWSCNGSNGGQNVSCSANSTVIPGTIRLPVTGQTSCWDAAGNLLASCAGTGQDGELQVGVAWPNPRFTVNGDQTMTDNLTGLIWSKDANPAGTPMTWQEALDYIKTLNSQKYLGHNDWRLPNVNELASLVNRQQALSFAWLNSQGFSNTQAYYWSSTTVAGGFPYGAWVVDFYKGFVGNYGKDGYGYVRCVRGGQPGALGILNLSQTGQTSCWDSAGNLLASCAGTGQDGELQSGVPWPNPRFIDNGDQTMTDSLTDLIWSKDANPAGVAKTWQEILDYINALNNQNYLGHNDWRLPNVNELASLINRQQADPAAWLNSQGFRHTQSSGYWSSTTDASNPIFAWSVYFGSGGVGSFYKNGYGNNYYVRCVRGGQSGGSVDSTLPVISAFVLPPVSTLTVPISTLTASDNVGVTGWCLTESPNSSSCVFSAAKPTSYTFTTAGAKTLYAWARDAAGNISDSVSRSVMVLNSTVPTGVIPTPGNGQVSVSWNVVSGATSYYLYYSTSPGVTRSTGTRVAAAASPKAVTGLTNGVTYYFVVTTVVSGTESAESAEVSAIPIAPVSPTTYTLADLIGVWYGNSLASGAGAPWWERATMTVAADGSFIATTVESDGNTNTISGNFVISSSGIVTLPGSPNFWCGIDSGKTVMVCTDTWTTGSPGTAEMKVFTKKGATYTQTDLTGTWDAHSIETPGPWWSRRTFIVAADGSFTTTGDIASSGPKTPLDGTLTLRSDGTIIWNKAAESAFRCTMDAGKTVVACTVTNITGTELAIWTKRAGGGYAQSDITGDWGLSGLASSPSSSWWRGTGAIDSSGAVISGVRYDSFISTPVDLTGAGAITVTQSGITCTFGNQSEPCTMNSGKTIIVDNGTDPDGSSAQLSILTKMSSSVVQTLSGLAITSGPIVVAEGGTATYTATAYWSDGTSTTVTPTWNLASTTYASIDSAGILTALAVPGDQQITIKATYTSGGITLKVSLPVTIVNMSSTLTISLSGDGSGGVNGTSNSSSVIACTYPQQSGLCSTSLTTGATVSLSATLGNLSIFGGWGAQCGTCSGTSCQLTLDSDKLCTATFTLAPKAKIGADGYPSFNKAYLAASPINRTTVLLLEDLLPITDIINKELILKGGHDPAFAGQGGYTTLQGTVTVGTGSAVMDRVIIR